MKISAVNDRALVRLIPQTYHKPPVLRGLVDSDEEYELLTELEGQTNARLLAERHGTLALDRRELAYTRRDAGLKIYGERHINAAFAYTRKGGNRFNDDSRGAWYCSFEDRTSIEEVAYHRTRELRFIGCFEDEATYVALLADFIGDFPDLQGQQDQPEQNQNQNQDEIEALHPDPARGYPAGQALAQNLRRAGHKGLLYPSVRSPGGRCFVAFSPGIIQNVRPGASWKLSWSGSPQYTVIAVSA